MTGKDCKNKEIRPGADQCAPACVFDNIKLFSLILEPVKVSAAAACLVVGAGIHSYVDAGKAVVYNRA